MKIKYSEVMKKKNDSFTKVDKCLSLYTKYYYILYIIYIICYISRNPTKY